MYTYEDKDKIMNFSSWSAPKKISELLRIDASLYANSGVDSTKLEKQKPYSQSSVLYKLIKELNPTKGDLFLRELDTKKK